MKEEDSGSVVYQDDLGLLTAEFVDFHLYKTALVLPLHPVSSAWLIARNLTGPLLD